MTEPEAPAEGAAEHRLLELYRLVLENVRDLITLVDARGSILYASPSHEQTLGYDPSELVGRDLTELVHPEDLDALRAERRVALQTSRGELESLRVRHADGHFVTLEGAVSAALGDDGRLLLLATSRDVGPQRETEAALRESRDLLEVVLGAVDDGITVLSAEGRFIYANSRALELIGVGSTEELTGVPADTITGAFQLFDPDGSPLPLERLPGRRVLLGEPSAREEVVYHGPGGEELRSVVHALPIRSADGTPRLAISVFRDVTAEHRAAQLLRVLAEANAVLGASLDEDATLRSIASIVVPELADRYAAELSDADVPRVVVDAELAAVARRSGAVEEAIETRAAVLPAAVAEEVGALLVVPLVSRGRTLGTFALGLAAKDRRFGAEEIRIAEELGRRVATAVDNARLFRETRQAAALAEASARSLLVLERISEAALEHLALDELLNRLLARLTEVMEADEAAILLLNEAGTALELRAATGFGPELESAVPIPLGQGMAGRIAATRQTAVFENLDEIRLASPHLRLRGIHGLVAVPLVAEGQTIGVMHVGTLEPARFTQADARLLELVGDRVALAIAQASLYEAEKAARRAAQEAQERLSFLAEASDVLASSLEYGATLASLARLTVPRLADWCAIDVLAPDGTIERLAVAHADPQKVALAEELYSRYPPEADESTGTRRVLRTGEPVLMPEIPDELLAERLEERPEYLAALRELGLRSMMLVPLVSRGRTLGVISLIWAESDRHYGPEDLAFAMELARRAATAVDNALLFRDAEERAQAARILQSVGDGVFLIDGSGVLRYWNRAAEAITGLRAAEVVERLAAEAIPGWLTIEPLVPIRGAPQSMPLQLPDREVWLSISGVALEEGTAYAFRDLTEDRALEELRTEFVSTVSHELRTPLAAIYGAAMTLRRRDVQLEESQREGLLAVVTGEADRLARIVNDILWTSRLDTGSLHVAIESCDAAGLAATVVEAQRAHLPAGIELQLRIAPALPQVAADPDKVRQVLVNLVDNAVKYSPDGGLVAVALARRGAHVRFDVADEGLGIPFAEQRRIFDKFYRLDPNLTRGVGGTGLGLYICRELVRRMDGRIWVESEPGRGSTFSIELPIAGGDEDVSAHLA